MVAASLWLFTACPVQAVNDPPLIGQPPASSAPQTFERREELFDDQRGLRLWLKEQGIEFDVTYINYDQNIVSGETTRGRDDDWGRIRFTVDVDLGRLARLSGLSSHLSAINQNGGNVGTNLGAYSNPNNLATTQSTRVDTYWLQQKLFDGVLVLRLGQLAQQDDYGSQEYGSSFAMEPLGYALGNLFGDVTATADPASKPGFEVQIYPHGDFYAKAMIQAGDQNPYGDHDHHGLNFSLDGHGVVASEIGYRREETSRRAASMPGSSSADDDKETEATTQTPGGMEPFWEGGLPAVYKLGAYNSFDDYVGPAGHRTHGNYLVYGMINQAIFREAHAGPGHHRGLDAFAGLDYSPDNVSLAYLQLTTGLRYTGLIAGHERDVLAVGLAHTEFSRRFNTTASISSSGRYTQETGLEINYDFHLTPWLTVQPVAQYYFNPGGTGRHSDAVLLGFGSKVVF